MRWHVYCRVVDNLGDVGFAWRFSADLAERGEEVRLALDDAQALAWMAPNGAPGVRVRAWDDEPETLPDVVVELFGGGLPGHVVRASSGGSAVRIDVEHLSAEPFVERSHRLRSGNEPPTWYFYPGFTDRTGGLVRERGLLERRLAFDAAAWRASIGLAVRSGERRVGLFCYPESPVRELIDALAARPTVLLAAAGAAGEQVRAELGPSMTRGALRAIALPLLSQVDFDRLLWTCDLNFVRGEDSPVRALWAGAPFVWQLYRQADGAHARKLEPFLDRQLADAQPALAGAVRALARRWNGIGVAPIDPTSFALAAGPEAPWPAQARRWRDELLRLPDLTGQLLGFARSRR